MKVSEEAMAADLLGEQVVVAATAATITDTLNKTPMEAEVVTASHPMEEVEEATMEATVVATAEELEATATNLHNMRMMEEAVLEAGEQVTQAAVASEEATAEAILLQTLTLTRALLWLTQPLGQAQANLQLAIQLNLASSLVFNPQRDPKDPLLIRFLPPTYPTTSMRSP